jgi:hypothetical protein
MLGRQKKHHRRRGLSVMNLQEKAIQSPPVDALSQG